MSIIGANVIVLSMAGIILRFVYSPSNFKISIKLPDFQGSKDLNRSAAREATGRPGAIY